MSDNIIPDRLYRIGIEGGELLLSPSYDFLNHFRFNGAWILKYFNQDSEPPTMCDVMMSEQSARWLMEAVGIECLERQTMSHSEHERWLEWSAKQLESAFAGEFDDTESLDDTDGE